MRVSADGQTLFVANGKGTSSAANPRGPFPGSPAPRNLQEYIGGLFQGTVALIALPVAKKRAEQFGAWSKTAYTCSPLDAAASPRGLAARPAGSPVPATVGDPSPIKYVIYVIRENRTYDQVLGDIPTGAVAVGRDRSKRRLGHLELELNMPGVDRIGALGLVGPIGTEGAHCFARYRVE